MEHPIISVLIPAAGGSKRLGQAKQLLFHQGKTLLQRAIEISESLAPLEIIIVTGAQAKAVAASTEQTSVRCINNADWETGMGSSIATGAGAIDERSDGVLILLCDQWRIQAQDLHTLLTEWQSNPKRIVVTGSGDYIGPPVIFPAACFKELRKLEGNRGAHSILENHPNLVSRVVMENAPYDLDTPSQLAALTRE